MEKLVKQISKSVDGQMASFYLDEKSAEYQIDWAEPRFENAGFRLKKASKFNGKDFSYKGKCKLKKVGKGNQFEERHIFLDRKTKHRFYLNAEEFTKHFMAKPKNKTK